MKPVNRLAARRKEEAARAKELRWAGMLVDVRLDDGSVQRTTIRHVPWQLGHGQWVVGLEGISGGYDVLRVTPVAEEKAN